MQFPCSVVGKMVPAFPTGCKRPFGRSGWPRKRNDHALRNAAGTTAIPSVRRYPRLPVCSTKPTRKWGPIRSRSQSGWRRSPASTVEPSFASRATTFRSARSTTRSISRRPSLARRCPTPASSCCAYARALGHQRFQEIVEQRAVSWDDRTLDLPCKECIDPDAKEGRCQGGFRQVAASTGVAERVSGTLVGDVSSGA